MATRSGAACEALLERALACPTAGDVSALLSAFVQTTDAPLIDVNLVDLDVDATSKDEAINAARSRRLMHEEFRERLRQETDPADLCALLRAELDPAPRSPMFSP